MSVRKTIRILLVEDNPTEILLLEEAFRDLSHLKIVDRQTDRLSNALALLRKDKFDAVLLDLGLPDSTGLDTFLSFREHAKHVPILVLTSLDDEQVGELAVQKGAQDYLIKSQIAPFLLGRAILYSIERMTWQRELELDRQKESQERELRGMAEMSSNHGASITDRLYCGTPLRESFPDEFLRMVRQYQEILDMTLESKTIKHNGEKKPSQELLSMSDTLGRLRASPGDIVEIHSLALKKKLKRTTPQKSQAYMEEGRFAVLELMGYLTSYYCNFYCLSHPEDPNS